MVVSRYRGIKVLLTTFNDGGEAARIERFWGER
jgi:hypothetical protein